MRLTVLALDYDGTIARNDQLDPDVLKAIADARERGITVVIVTGRILDDLRRVADDLGFVDAVVAENGAVVAVTDAGERRCTFRLPIGSSLHIARATSRKVLGCARPRGARIRVYETWPHNGRACSDASGVRSLDRVSASGRPRGTYSPP